MAKRNEPNRGEPRNSDTDVTGGKDEAIDSEATPGADPDRDSAYDSSTSGVAEEIQDPSDTPPPAQRGRDLDH